MSIYPPPGGKGPSGEARGSGAKPEPNPSGDNAWSLKIATVSGIPIRLHFTFLLVVLWLAVSDLGMGGLILVASLFGLFFCVALHELGHSLVAQRFGYPVREITLYPIGGVATIEGSPTPRHELFIALAGPAVNVAIASLLTLVLALTSHLPSGPVTVEAISSDPWLLLLQANIMLALFNMIPAFPMDGGRVLRAALGLRLGKPRATRIAARFGQFVALLMGIWGLGILGNLGVPGNHGNIGLVIIALFVFFGAAQEAHIEATHDVVEDAPVQDAMVRDFQTLSVGDTLHHAAELLLATSQQDFPVVHGDEVVGVLSRARLLRALAQDGNSAYVAGAMTRDVVFAHPDDPLEDLMLRPDGVQHAPILVVNDTGHLVGMLTIDNLMEFLTLRRIEQARVER